LVLDEQVKLMALDAWFKTPQGQHVAEAFTSELKKSDGALSGRRLLQLGVCGDNSWLSALHFRQKWLVSPMPSVACSVTCISSVLALPVARNSIDCVLAPLTLEACSRNKHPLDEIDRVLKPMGYVIILGVNPWSFWGAACHLQRACFAKNRATLRSSLSVKHALLNRGYRQCFLSSFYYIPPIKQEKIIHKLEFLNQMGKMIWPYPAGFYCFIAQKYDPCMLPLQMQQQDLYLARA